MDQSEEEVVETAVIAKKSGAGRGKDKGLKTEAKELPGAYEVLDQEMGGGNHHTAVRRG